MVKGVLNETSNGVAK